jgi:hypothetical protein
MTRERVAVAIVVAVLLCNWSAPIASAQIRIQFITPEERVAELFSSRDYAGAAVYIDEQLSRRPDDAHMIYNLACARARLGEHDAAADLLMRAIKAGFNDFSLMRRDDDLIAIRSHRTFETLVAALQAADDLIARRQLELCLEPIHLDSYRIDRESLPGIALVTHVDGADGETLAPRIRDHLQTVSRFLFEGAALAHRLNVVLPSNEDGSAMLYRRHAGGVYRHNQRMLIALDDGTCLRHELVHALHHGEMDRLGQQHPPWIEEGLAVLFEDYATDSMGDVDFPQTGRDNFARLLLRDGKLLPWSVLLTDDEAVTADPARSYAQLRSVMRFLHERFGVPRFFALYVDAYENDTTGTAALEQLSGVRLAELESQWIQWLSAQPITVGDMQASRRASSINAAQRTTHRVQTDRISAIVVPPGSDRLPPMAW